MDWVGESQRDFLVHNKWSYYEVHACRACLGCLSFLDKYKGTPLAVVKSDFWKLSYKYTQAIRLSESITELEDECFKGFNMLQRVYLCEGIRKIGKRVFPAQVPGGLALQFIVNTSEPVWSGPPESPFELITFPMSLEEIGDEAFSGIRYHKYLKFRNGSHLRKIGAYAFNASSLRFVMLPMSLTELGEYSFSQCEYLHTVLFERGSIIKKLGVAAFYQSAIKMIQIPKWVEEIDYFCFIWCTLLSDVWFEKGSNIKIIRDKAFCGTRIRNFLVPKSVESIGNECFANCGRLREVLFECGSNLEHVGNEIFKDSPVSHLVLASTDAKIADRIFDSGSLDRRNVTIVNYDHSESVRRDVTYNIDIDIGEYKQIKNIGSGRFGKVVLCEKDGNYVAAKFIPMSALNQQIFKREIENMKTLRHPYIVKLRGFTLPSTQNDHCVIVMDYISNSLESKMKYSSGNVDPYTRDQKIQTIFLICRIALGMAFVHSKCIIHGDLKPANILIDNTNVPYICDFGSSRLFSLKSVTDVAKSFTPRYAAPELYDDVISTEKIDVYSFGVIIYEIITRTVAFSGMSQLQLAKYISCGNRPTIPASVTPFARDLITRCWAQNPEDRPSFVEICKSLESNACQIFQIMNLDILYSLPWNFVELYTSSIHIESQLELPILDINKDHTIEVKNAKPDVPIPTRSASDGMCEKIIDIAGYKQIRKLGSEKVVLSEKGGTLVVLKFLPSGEMNQCLFEREIKHLGTLSHPNIVKLRGFSLPSCHNDYQFVIAMDYISGDSLETVMNKNPVWFDNSTKTAVISRIATAMAFVHSNGILHRDLTPANVIIDDTKEHNPYICNFGSSRLLSLESTMTTCMSCTPSYTAPELHTEDSCSQKVDVYSFGIILYEIITGNRAFCGMSQIQLINHIASGKRPVIPDSVTEFAREMITQCWAQQPEDRPSFNEICDALKNNIRMLMSQ